MPSRRCFKRRLSCIWLPAEVWVDVFKFLARRTLLHNVQSICRRFHALAERHVDNLHIVRYIEDFLNALTRNCRKANERCKHLASSDASLARHFRLDANLEFYLNREYKHPARAKRLRRAQLCFLRHSVEFFGGCRLRLDVNNDNRNEFPVFLALLRRARPFDVEIMNLTAPPDLQPEEMLREPTTLDCPRLTFRQLTQLTLGAESICNWLHHWPIEDYAQVQECNSGTRIFNVVEYSEMQMQNNTFAETIECCKKRLQQSVSPSDRRAFLLNFRCKTHDQLPFRIDHPATGEVLQLEQYYHNPEYPYYWYHLRRCSVADVALVTDQFYDVTIRDSGYFFFRTPVKDGLEAPTLTIQPFYIEIGII